MKKVILPAAGIALALTANVALAADLPNRKSEPVYAPPAPSFSWTGFYGGVNIGYGFGNGDSETGSLVYPSPPAVAGYSAIWSAPTNLSGVLGGGQLGYNYQVNPWVVVGIETDFHGADVNYQNLGAGPGTGAQPHTASILSAKSVDWFGTVRGRLGFTPPSLPNLLVYGTAGLAYGQVAQSVGILDPYPNQFYVGQISYSDVRTGWTAGAGLEFFPFATHPFFKDVSVKVEYLYTDLGSNNLFGTSALNIFAGAPTNVAFNFNHASETRFHTVRAGVNWHFDPFAVTPVVARY